MEFKEEDEIENASFVTNHFGYWPSFHDSEVISMRFRRNFKDSSPSIDFQIYAFEMTNKIKGRHFELIKHCIIEFELFEINNNSMDGFNHQNVLSGIDFSREGEWLVCKLNAAYGVEAKFEAKKIHVKYVMPIEKDSVQH